jgi:hypothetical protein
MRKLDTAAGQPAVTLPGIVTEQDRAIVTRREAGETRKAICEALGVNVSTVQRAEWRFRRDAEGRADLAKCPDSIRGLEILGELDSKAALALGWHHHNHEGGRLESMSEVAALGRAYVSRMKGIGPASLASIDHVLGVFGIAWSPVERTPQPKRPEPEQDREQSRNEHWESIVARVARLERVTGKAFLEDSTDRDTVDGVLCRLSFLTGYLEESAAARARTFDGEYRRADDQADTSGEDLETAGNLVCLPGVKLADVLHDGGAS